MFANLPGCLKLKCLTIPSVKKNVLYSNWKSQAITGKSVKFILTLWKTVALSCISEYMYIP